MSNNYNTPWLPRVEQIQSDLARKCLQVERTSLQEDALQVKIATWKDMGRPTIPSRTLTPSGCPCTLRHVKAGGLELI
ncbi:hypothetical protein LZ31DRAFT_217207 [Colletotrichum somersetense]|nr:hypothetical protein LZ31DRAFT_217207 [Colletotrichum somersetense]